MEDFCCWFADGCVKKMKIVISVIFHAFRFPSLFHHYTTYFKNDKWINFKTSKNLKQGWLLAFSNKIKTGKIKKN